MIVQDRLGIDGLVLVTEIKVGGGGWIKGKERGVRGERRLELNRSV